MMHKWRASLFAFLLVGALGLFFLVTSSAYAACPDGMTSYWKLDEASGPTYEDFFNGNDGTGNDDPTAVTGIVNGAQEFDGTMGIDVPADSSFGWYQNESFSIEYWVKRDDSVPLSINEVTLGREDSLSQVRWWAGLTQTTQQARFYLRDNTGVEFLVTGTKDVVDGAWHHVVAIRDAAADELRIYVDGAWENTTINATYGAGFASNSADINIGWLNLDPFYHFKGTLDEVALYNRALTPTEIEDHYNDRVGKDYCPGGTGPFPKELTSYWKLDEASGPTYEDSFNGNDGTGNNDPTAVTGIVNGAQEFDGTMGIDVPADSSFGWYQNESFSIEYWVKRDDSVPLSINEVTLGRDDRLTSLHWWTGIDGGTGRASFVLRDINGNGAAGDLEGVGTINLADGSWHHVVAVRDDSTNENLIYVDGGLQGSAGHDYTAGFDSTSVDLNIGWLNLDPFHRFKGALDEVALYNRALTPAEIQQHYDDGVAGWGIGYIPVAGFTADPISGVYPLPVNFTDQSTGNITSWSWDFGDGIGTSTQQSPSYTYDDTGTYTVSLTVTGPYGTDTETKNDYIVVADIAPVANFTADPISGVVPLTVNFTDGSTGNFTSWSWDFGDGVGTSTDQNPTYIYNNVGTYTVEFTVTGPGGSDTETKTDYITVNYPAPVADFTADPISGVHPLEVDFTDESTGNITSWSWDFGDGVGTSTEQDPTYIYIDAGGYIVSLTVTGPGGSDTETKTDYITVSNPKSKSGGGGGCFITTAAE